MNKLLNVYVWIIGGFLGISLLVTSIIVSLVSGQEESTALLVASLILLIASGIMLLLSAFIQPDD